MWGVWMGEESVVARVGLWDVGCGCMQGRPWLTRGPVRGMEWGPPRSVCNGVTGGVGGGVFDSVRRGARGPVRPHQLHRPKDGPGCMAVGGFDEEGVGVCVAV